MATKVGPTGDIRPTDRRESYLDLHASGCVVFTLIALGYLASLFALQLHHPVIYVLLLAEDSWGENATFAGYTLTAFLVGRLAVQPGPRHQRVIWAVIAAIAAFIAFEEISWGQRIFGLSTPELLLEINDQGELNFHNIEGFPDEHLRKGVGRGLFAWTLISAAALQVRQRFSVNPMARGLPFFPLRLWACCFVVVWLFERWPVIRSDEFGELALALLALVWAADLYVHFSTRPARGSERLLRNRFTAFVAAAALTSALTLTFPENSTFGWWLNFAAAHKFPNSGLMEQSREIFDYILANPQYATDETLTNYRRLFPDQNDQ
jgi:hypothetical protein